MNEYLFSYGTLQKEQVQLKLFGRTLNGVKDTLQGYKVAAIEITDQAFLSKGEQKDQLTVIPTNDINDRIEGTALEMKPEELLLADKYEPVNYKRVSVELLSGKKAWVYAATTTI